MSSLDADIVMHQNFPKYFCAASLTSQYCYHFSSSSVPQVFQLWKKDGLPRAKTKKMAGYVATFTWDTAIAAHKHRIKHRQNCNCAEKEGDMKRQEKVKIAHSQGLQMNAGPLY